VRIQIIDLLPPTALITERPPALQQTALRHSSSAETTYSLFERVSWLYAFCREHLFRDDTARIISTIWQNSKPHSGTKVIELGCGPGFYSRNLALRFPQLVVLGVDRSESQLRSARQRASARNVANCLFQRVNALSLPFEEGSFDVVIA